MLAASLWGGLAIADTPPPVPAGQDIIPHDVIPPLAASSARLRFHQGAVKDNQPEIAPALPDLPGAPSPWYVAQWLHGEYLSAPMLHESRDRDGRAIVSARTRNGELALSAAHRDGEDGLVFTLSEQDGSVAPGGGSNLFLTAPVLLADATLDRPTLLSMDARVAAASITAADAARESGTVMAMAFAGLGLQFDDPDGGTGRFVFLQIPITGSSPTPATAPAVICHLQDDVPQLLYGPAPDRHYSLDFHAESGALHRLRADISAIVRRMLSEPFPCDGRMVVWSPAMRNLARWRITGFYVGLEAQNRDLRPQAATDAPQGRVRLSLDLADIRLTQVR